MKRLTVLYLSDGDDPRGEPWFPLTSEALRGQHDLVVFEPDAPVAAQLRDVNVVLDVASTRSRALADAAANVELWQLLGVGIDGFDLEYWSSRQITVAHCPGEISGAALAEWALLLIIMLRRSVVPAFDNLREGVFGGPLGDELAGQTLGLVGFGASARELATRAHACGMRIVALNRSSISREDVARYHLVRALGPSDLDELLATSDVVSLHLPLTPHTRCMLDARRLGLMRRGALLINVSRGALVDETALLRALDQNIGGAGLDVFGEEPLPSGHPLLAHPRVVATPHVAGGTRQAMLRRASMIADNIALVAAGQPPLHVVSSDVD